MAKSSGTGIADGGVWTNEDAWVLTWTGSGLSWSEGDTISLILAGPAANQPRQTTVTNYWEPTLTVVDLDPRSSGVLGCWNGHSGDECRSTAVLTDDDFTYESVNYVVTRIFASGGTLGVMLNRNASALKGAALTLHVGSARLNLANAELLTDNQQLTWRSTGLSWSVGDTVSLRLATRVGGL